jgi:hypothetical protein
MSSAGEVTMPTDGIGVADRLKAIGMTALGIILCIIPLALWVAWTETVLFMVLAAGAVSALLLVFLADAGTSAVEQPRRDGTTPEALTDESVAAIHRIFPLTYHHSVTETARFRRTMDKVRHLIRRSDREDR